MKKGRDQMEESKNGEKVEKRDNGQDKDEENNKSNNNNNNTKNKNREQEQSAVGVLPPVNW